MRNVLVIATIICATSSGLAQARPNSLAMSCAATAGLVRQSGAMVIGTGPNLFDRFVASGRFCEPTETTEPAWIATKDNRQCFVGYRCVEAEFFFR